MNRSKSASTVVVKFATVDFVFESLWGMGDYGQISDNLISG